MNQTQEYIVKQYGRRQVTHRADAVEGNVEAGMWLMKSSPYSMTMANIAERVINFGGDLEKIVRKTGQLPKIERVGPLTYDLLIRYFKEVRGIKVKPPEGVEKEKIPVLGAPPARGSLKRNRLRM